MVSLDYVNIMINNINTSRLVNLPILNFKTDFSEKTGEISNKKTARYHFCKIKIYDSGRVFFSGSIHKMYNSINNIKAPSNKAQKKYKGFNGNDFLIENIFEVRKHLEYLFMCKPNQMKFLSLEAGVNLNTPFNPTKFISTLLYHHGTPFDFKYNRNLSEMNHSMFVLKFYNKGLQYEMKQNILRCEIKTRKMKVIESTGIKTFEDINIKTLEALKNILIEKIDKVVYFDSSISKTILKKKPITRNFGNINYWMEELTPKNRGYSKKILNEVIEKHSGNLKKLIIQLINEKHKINSSYNTVQKFGIINQFSEAHRFGIINTSSIPLNIPLDSFRYCLMTGVDISMQKEDSILLSHAGLHYYFQTDKILFNEIKKKYLPSKWKNENLKIQIKEIAHNIRSLRKNQLRKQKRIYKNHQQTLFKINSN